MGLLSQSVSQFQEPSLSPTVLLSPESNVSQLPERSASQLLDRLQDKSVPSTKRLLTMDMDTLLSSSVLLSQSLLLLSLPLLLLVFVLILRPMAMAQPTMLMVMETPLSLSPEPTK